MHNVIKCHADCYVTVLLSLSLSLSLFYVAGIYNEWLVFNQL